jgi:flagellar hook-length control protein FliK
MGLLLLLMGVGISPTEPQGLGDAPMLPATDLAADVAPVEDEAPKPTPTATEIDAAQTGVVDQRWPMTLELYSATTGMVASEATEGATDPPPTPTAGAEAIGMLAPVDTSRCVVGSAPLTLAAKRPSVAAGEATTPAAVDPATSGPQARPPVAAEAPGVEGRDERDLALRLDATGSGPHTAAAVVRAHRDRAGLVAPETPRPGAPEVPPVVGEVKPPASSGAAAANAAGQLTVSARMKATSSAAPPEPSEEAPANTAMVTRQGTPVRPVAATQATTVPAIENVDPGDDRQASAGRHRTDSGLAIDSAHPYARHALPDVGGAHSIASAAPVDAPTAPAAPRFVEQIVHTARLVVNEGLAQMDVQLEPPELGAVRVSAAATADSIGLTLSAERPETRALLEQAIPQIQAALSVRGVTTASIAVAGNFDPPDARRAPFRREADRGDRSGQHPRERHRPASDPRPVGLVNLTV